MKRTLVALAGLLALGGAAHALTAADGSVSVENGAVKAFSVVQYITGHNPTMPSTCVLSGGYAETFYLPDNDCGKRWAVCTSEDPATYAYYDTRYCGEQITPADLQPTFTIPPDNAFDFWTNGAGLFTPKTSSPPTAAGAVGSDESTHEHCEGLGGSTGYCLESPSTSCSSSGDCPGSTECRQYICHLDNRNERFDSTQKRPFVFTLKNDKCQCRAVDEPDDCCTGDNTGSGCTGQDIANATWTPVAWRNPSEASSLKDSGPFGGTGVIFHADGVCSGAYTASCDVDNDCSSGATGPCLKRTHFTFPSELNGMWGITAIVRFSADATGVRRLRLINAAYPTFTIAETTCPSAGGSSATLCTLGLPGIFIGKPYFAESQTYYRIEAYQDSGSSLVLLAGTFAEVQLNLVFLSRDP